MILVAVFLANTGTSYICNAYELMIGMSLETAQP